MIKEIISRIKQKHRTVPFPFRNIKLSKRYRGYPEFNTSKIRPEMKKELFEICPTDSFIEDNSGIGMDIGRCVFCGKCAKKFPEVIKFSSDYSMAVSNREDLVIHNNSEKKSVILRNEIKKLFGKSLKLRQVSAGGCNACEADCNVLSTLAFDIGRFGISFVASPRHADGILITGPVTKNMEIALKKTYEAVSEPKIVIAVGSCAVSGGIYRGLRQTKGPGDIKIDLFIPGCPPNPYTILDGLLRFIGRIG